MANLKRTTFLLCATIFLIACAECTTNADCSGETVCVEGSCATQQVASLDTTSGTPSDTGPGGPTVLPSGGGEGEDTEEEDSEEDTDTAGHDTGQYENCYPTQMIISDADLFNSLSGYDCILGDLTISIAGAYSFEIYLPDLQYVGGDLSIRNNGVLSDLYRFPVLARIEGALFINGNDILTTLTGLEALEYVGGDISIWNNDLLGDLSALASLSHVGGDLQISSNFALASLDGLDALTAIGGSLILSNNDSLNNISGLSGLDTLGGGLIATDNPLLADCLLCDLLGQLAAPPEADPVTSGNSQDNCTTILDGCAQ